MDNFSNYGLKIMKVIVRVHIFTYIKKKNINLKNVFLRKISANISAERNRTLMRP